MASDAMMQAIGRIERALSRAEGIARQLAEARARALDERLAAMEAETTEAPAIDIDPLSRDKAIAARLTTSRPSNRKRYRSVPLVPLVLACFSRNFRCPGSRYRLVSTAAITCCSGVEQVQYIM